MTVVLRGGAQTDPGKVRSSNQDRFLKNRSLFAVADGMGGHAGGEVAARVAVETVDAIFGEQAGEWPTNLLASSFQSANSAVHSRSQSDPKLRGMGTTLVCLVAARGPKGDRIVIANVGDSRAYVVKNQNLVQITKDHTLVQDMLDKGELTPSEASTHQHRHILTRAIGTEPTVEIDAWQLIPAVGDRYLLCSDGLFNEASENEIASLLLRTKDPDTAASQLVNLARSHGGSDNITAVVVDVISADNQGQSPSQPAASAPSPMTGSPTPSMAAESPASQPAGSGSAGSPSGAAGLVASLGGGALGAAMMGITSAPTPPVPTPPSAPEVPRRPVDTSQEPPPSPPQPPRERQPEPEPETRMHEPVRDPVSNEPEPERESGSEPEPGTQMHEAVPNEPEPEPEPETQMHQPVLNEPDSEPEPETQMHQKVLAPAPPRAPRTPSPGDTVAGISLAGFGAQASMSDILSETLARSERGELLPPAASRRSSPESPASTARIESEKPGLFGRRRDKNALDAVTVDRLYAAREHAEALRDSEDREALRDAMRFAEARSARAYGRQSRLLDQSIVVGPRRAPESSSDEDLEPDPVPAKLLTPRVVAFAAAIVLIIAGAFGSVVWFAKNSYYVGLSGTSVAIFQGRPGGLAWFQPHLVRTTTVTTAQILPSRVSELQNGVLEPSLSASLAYVANLAPEKNVAAGGGAAVPSTTAPPPTAPPSSSTTAAPVTSSPTTVAPTTAPTTTAPTSTSAPSTTTSHPTN